MTLLFTIENCDLNTVVLGSAWLPSLRHENEEEKPRIKLGAEIEVGRGLWSKLLHKYHQINEDHYPGLYCSQ